MSEAPGTSAPSGVTRWRKRPVVLEGIAFDGINAATVLAFAGGDVFGPHARMRGGVLEVWNEQEQQWLTVPAGHVVMRGALGELYGVSPAALEATFDPAGDGEEAGQ